jgi:coatomer subunit beta
MCLRVLSSDPEEQALKAVFLEKCRYAYDFLTNEQEVIKSVKTKLQKKKDSLKNHGIYQNLKKIDDPIKFSLLKPKKASGSSRAEYDMDLDRATGLDAPRLDTGSKLSHIVPLTGYSDPVYVEAYINVHQYDIVMGNIHCTHFRYFNS